MKQGWDVYEADSINKVLVQFCAYKLEGKTKRLIE